MNAERSSSKQNRPEHQRDRDRVQDNEPKAAACAVHSFDPDTLVLMADGTARPIAEVNIGDTVATTDPATGEHSDQQVTLLHANRDTELTDVTVSAKPADQATRSTGEGEGERSTRGPTAAVLHTTAHHPFWDATTGDWVDAADLIPGESTLVGPDGQIQYVTDVRNFTGAKVMRDLTVAVTHTYYVIAGNTSVLVHNNDGCLEVTANEKSYSISHGESGSGVIADLDDDGILTLMMQRNQGSPISGREMFDRVMEHFGDRVNGVQGYWVYGDNLAAFNAAVRGGDPLRSAARGTWTGRQAARYGFTRVKILVADENLDGFTRVSAMFRRERG